MIAELNGNAFDVAEEIRREAHLFDSVEAAFRDLEPFRNLNHNLTNEYLGHNYGSRSRTGKRKKYVNKMFQAVNGHMMLLAANCPQAFINTEYLELRPFAKHYQTHINNLLKKINAEQTIHDWVLSGIFCLGVVKIHLYDSGFVRYEADTSADPGIPYLSNVYLDDWVHDMSVRRASQFKFCGDMYRIPFADFRQGIRDGVYIPENSIDLHPTTKEESDAGRVDRIASGQETDLDEYEPMIDLADIWLPREGVIKTFAVQNRKTFRLMGRPVAVMEWDGVERGPYEILSISNAPENVMPASIAGYWEAMDEFINIAMRKNVRHITNMKENLCANSAGTSTATKLTKGNDQEVLTGMDLSTVKMFRQGGADPNLAIAIQQASDQFDEMANNLKSILGTGPQADTLGQEQLIRSAGNQIAQQMQYRVISATTNVIESLACLLWKDEWTQMAGNIQVTGHRGEVTEIPSPWEPGDRWGDFWQYNFSVVPFSMVKRSPGQQAEMFLGLLQRVYLPGLEAMMAQGISLDWSELNNILSDLLYMPELRRCISVQGMPNPEMQRPQSSIAGSKPPVTTRNYNRRSSGGGPPSGNQLVHQAPLRNGASSWADGGGVVE